MAKESNAEVWIDDSNVIFRRGMIASLRSADFAVTGESSKLSPEPDMSAIHVLIFEADKSAIQQVANLARGTSTRLVGVTNSPEEHILLEAVESGLAGFLIRQDLTPDTLVACLRAVTNGSGSMPPDLLASLIERLTNGGKRATNGRGLARREVDVLHLLATGADTREIAQSLCYSERTVKNIVHDVLVKMNCRTRAHAVALATRQGFI